MNLVLVALLAACSGSPAPSDGPKEPEVQLTKVRLALNWFPEPEFGGFYEGALGGHYKSAGFDVEILPGGPGAPSLELLSAAYATDAKGQAVVRPTRERLAFAGYFATGHRIFDETTAILPIETLRTQLGYDLMSPGSIDLITDVAIRPRDGLSPEQLRACQRRLQAAVQPL